MKRGVWIIDDKDEKKIVVTHVNVRQSIFSLLAKLVLLDIVATLIALAFFTPFFLPLASQLKAQIVAYNAWYFLIVFGAKVALTLFVVLEWLNEYYEITPDAVVHRRGIIWRRVEKYKLHYVRLIGMQQGLFGRFFNYGSLQLHDWFNDKYIVIYLIHNPQRYMEILEDLLPAVSREKEMIRERIRDKEEGD